MKEGLEVCSHEFAIWKAAGEVDHKTCPNCNRVIEDRPRRHTCIDPNAFGQRVEYACWCNRNQGGLL